MTAKLSPAHQSSGGFTLIELLVVSMLAILIIVGASSLFLSSLVSSSHTDTLTTVKEEGDFAIGQMEILLRNAVTLEPDPSAPLAPVCTTNMSKITFRERDNGITTLGIVNNKIASTSGAKTVYLTSTDVTIDNTKPIFDCTQMSNIGGYVNIQFDLSDTPQGGYQSNSVIKDTFTTSVNLRSF